MVKNKVVKYDVLLLTESTLDIILEIEGSFPILGGCTRRVKNTFLEPGGEGNILIMFSRMGGKILPVGPLGDDYYGTYLRNAYKKQGIDTSCLKTVKGFDTPVANCIIDEQGEHSFVSYLKGCEFVEEEEVAKLLEECGGLFVSGYHIVDADSAFFRLTLRLIDAAKKQGIPIFFDPGPLAGQMEQRALQKVLANSTVISLNNEEACSLTKCVDEETAAEKLAEQTNGVIVVKAGGQGCYVWFEGKGKWYPGFQVKVVDTMGAGDSFLGALMYAWVKGFDMDTCFILANAAGAVKTAKFGTGTKVPTFDEMVAILERNGYNIPEVCKNVKKFVELKLEQ